MRTVPSSEAEAMRLGMAGFQLTQLTVRVWPVSSAIGSSPRRCQMYTLWSVATDKESNKTGGRKQGSNCRGINVKDNTDRNLESLKKLNERKKHFIIFHKEIWGKGAEE